MKDVFVTISSSEKGGDGGRVDHGCQNTSTAERQL